MDNSSLFDEKTFYQTFLEDLKHCQKEVIIESPFITSLRMKKFDRVFQNLLKKGVKNIYYYSTELEGGYETQSEEAVRWCEEVGI